MIAGCATVERQAGLIAVPEIRPGVLAGYLQLGEHPDSLMLIPPPPAEGSAELALDKEINQKDIERRGTPRWDLAARDAILMFPEAADTFSCALTIPITEKNTPHLYMLLRRTLADASLSTHKAKNRYRRKRPFMENNEPTCTPNSEKFLRKNGSYPSGHTAIGWAWALILTEIAPERADALLSRGRDFGESRAICNVHWHSDVVEGRFMGAATVARLHGDPEFLVEIKAARAEFAAIRARGLKSPRDCQAETDAPFQHFQPLTGEAEILQSWQGDYPVDQLQLLPDDQRKQSNGFIHQTEVFENVWRAFKPDEVIPEVDFKANIVLFNRNTHFYSRISIGKVDVINGVAELLTMETMSAMPIEDEVALSMVVIPQKGIQAIQAGDKTMLINKTIVPLNQNR